MFKPSLIKSIQTAGLRLFKSASRASHSDTVGRHALLKKADRLIKNGEVRAAEGIYKSTIEEYPRCEEAYQKLWGSWIAHRSLKVTQKELDDFIELYKKNIGVDGLEGLTSSDSEAHSVSAK